MDETDNNARPDLLERLKARVRDPTTRMGRTLLIAAIVFVGAVITLIIIDEIRSSTAGAASPNAALEARGH